MYGSVSALDIVHLVQNQAGLPLEKRYIQLPHAIKAVGDHTIKVKLKEGILSSIKLKIEAEEVPGAAKAPAAAEAPEAE